MCVICCLFFQLSSWGNVDVCSSSNCSRGHRSSSGIIKNLRFFVFVAPGLKLYECWVLFSTSEQVKSVPAVWLIFPFCHEQGRRQRIRVGGGWLFYNFFKWLKSTTVPDAGVDVFAARRNCPRPTHKSNNRPLCFHVDRVRLQMWLVLIQFVREESEPWLWYLCVEAAGPVSFEVRGWVEEWTVSFLISPFHKLKQKQKWITFYMRTHMHRHTYKTRI